MPMIVITTKSSTKVKADLGGWMVDGMLGFMVSVSLCYQSSEMMWPLRGSQRLAQSVGLMVAAIIRTLPSPTPTFIPDRCGDWARPGSHSMITSGAS